MSEIKVEFVHAEELYDAGDKAAQRQQRFMIPVVRVEALRNEIKRMMVEDSENGLSPDGAWGFRTACQQLLAQLEVKG